MKNYLKPVTESIDIKSVDCFMAMGTSDGHGQTTDPNPAPKKKGIIQRYGIRRDLCFRRGPDGYQI